MLNYKAGQSITLEPGFETGPGATFTAEIGDICSNNKSLQVNIPVPVIKGSNRICGESTFTVENADGNVGIGTTTIPAGYKLAVDGKIICERIKVIADVPGADYVFDKNYKLLPLNELENYIDTCKHLPDVPSADEMNRNGIDLTEMNILLLKKIEELTLYLIKQDKRINELEKSIIK